MNECKRFAGARNVVFGTAWYLRPFADRFLQANKTMVDNTAAERTVYQALNDIAEHWSVEEELPADTTTEDVTALCESVYGAVSQRIETLESQSGLSRIEAEVWALKKTSDQRGDSLTDEAIAHVLCVDGSPFGNVSDGSGGENVIPATPGAVKHVTYEVTRKYQEAKGLVKETVAPGHESELKDGRLVCLDWQTVIDLRDRRANGETATDDTVRRLLAETAECRTIKEFAREYLAARGKDAVVQLVLHRPRDESGVIHFTAHTASSRDVPDVVSNTDGIEVDGERYDFMLTEDPYGPSLGKQRVTVFSSCEIEGQEPVALTDGIEVARDVIEDDRFLPRPQPTA